MADSVLVTGAGKGIGRACVERLAAAGFRVYAGVRKEQDGAALRSAIRGDIVPVILDVCDAASISETARRIDEAGMPLRGVVNNAGIAVAGPLEFLPVEELRRQLEVNVVGQVAVTQAMLPLLRRSRGRVINIGSIAGRSAMPMTGAYSASKHALEAVTDALRVELMPAGIDVVIIEPGVIATPIWETPISTAESIFDALPPQLMEYYGRIINGARERALGNTTSGLPADAVAIVVEHALTAQRPKTRYVVGRDAKLRKALQLLPDRVRDRIIARQLARM